jgi:hypothetical protein
VGLRFRLGLGVREVEDELRRIFLLDDGEGVEELVGDVGEDGGTAGGDFVFDDQINDGGEEVVDLTGGIESVGGAKEELGEVAVLGSAPGVGRAEGMAGAEAAGRVGMEAAAFAVALAGPAARVAGGDSAGAGGGIRRCGWRGVGCILGLSFR